ncbi:MAG TPA: hypothetical protein PKD80_07450 [Microthrixaceae bacterium]|nr:hypothetical protein [Microthrixaceae bacterium]HMS12925.1 hypothetical protein [Microthrixaceae bacterium]HMT24188.1 hypothetical protein [Microthrixaceae bacterium]HMT60805.1 hypothetical protein [Microthrixaceae bacterium]
MDDEAQHSAPGSAPEHESGSDREHPAAEDAMPDPRRLAEHEELLTSIHDDLAAVTAALDELDRIARSDLSSGERADATRAIIASDRFVPAPDRDVASDVASETASDSI